MLNFRGEDPKEILKLVRKVERNTAVISKHLLQWKSNTNRVVYLHNKTWLKVCKKRNKYLNLQSLLSIFRFLIKGHFRRAVSEFLAYDKVIAETDIAATLVRIKNNVLVLYPDIGLASKIQRPNSARDAEFLKNEYSILKDIVDLKGINAPEPIAYENDISPVLWMKYIDGRNLHENEKAKVSFQIAASLFIWYEYRGIKTIRPNEYKLLVQIFDRGVSGLMEQGWTEPNASVIHKLLTTVADLGIKLVVSQIHGDVSTGNVMVSQDNELIITDWENSRRDLITYDIHKLVAINPKIEHRYFEWLTTKLDVTNVNLKYELALTLVLSNVDLNKRRRY